MINRVIKRGDQFKERVISPKKNRHFTHEVAYNESRPDIGMDRQKSLYFI